MKTETPREIAEQISSFSLVAFHDNADAVRAQLARDIERALRNASNRVCDECASDLSDGSGFCATCDNFTMPSDFYLRWVRRTQMDAAVDAERERCAKIADKKGDILRKAAHVVQQPTEEALRMAELAIVSADDIAREIRGKQV